jgi:2-polyprenyl-6-methoxyphenol hydroxylase-like FAD-dependent oxidoreductase
MATATIAIPVLIIGAGISGLTLAQHLRKQGIPFRIFERDASMTSRTGGWGLTIHWAHALLCDMLPDEVVQRLEESHVNRDAFETGDYGRFTLFDLSTGIAKYNVPAGKRMRFSRGKLREVLAMGIEIEVWNFLSSTWVYTNADAVLKWSKQLRAIDSLEDSAVAHFEDGTSAKGCLVVGCDGSRSRLRQIIYPSAYRNRSIPVRMLGVTPRYSVVQAAGARAIDPYFFQGTDSKSDVYMFFSCTWQALAFYYLMH